MLTPKLPTNLAEVAAPVSALARTSQPNPTAHSCCHCQRILVSPPLDRGQRSFRCRLPYSKIEVRRAAKDGCPVCKLLMYGYLSATSVQGAREFARGLQQPNNWKFMRAGAVRPRDRIVYLAESLSKRPFQIRFDGQGNALFTCMGWSSLWFSVTAASDDHAATVVPTRPINRDIASKATFQTAKGWLRECIGHSANSAHSNCLSPAKVHFVPTRLLEITSSNGMTKVRLHTTNGNESLDYCCLSYCWGGDQPLKTTLATLKFRLSSINLVELPQTLKDAIVVAIHLDLRYMWIDCLCIIQDDMDDVAREIGQMPLIYTKALLTISASSAITCRDGFLHARSYPIGTTCEDLMLRYQCPEGGVGNIYLSELRPYNTDEDPVNTRAWTLQERVLSQRVLDYGVRQLRWHCRSRHCFDGGLPDEMTDYESAPASRFPAQFRMSGKSSAEIDLEEVVLRDWGAIVDDYTKRSVTFSVDKLVAISALASEMGRYYSITYLAGVWREYLPAQLLWRLWKDPSQRPAEYRSPSWSWASVDSWVMLQRATDSVRVAIEVLDCSTSPAHPSVPYGAVTAGYLTVKGRLKEGQWFYNQDSKIILAGIPGSYGACEPAAANPESDEVLPDDDDFDDSDTAEDSDESQDNKNDDDDDDTLDAVDITRDALEAGWNEADRNASTVVWCLQVMMQGKGEGKGTEGLILLPLTDGNQNPFKRVGHFYFDVRETEIFHDADKRIVTIH